MEQYPETEPQSTDLCTVIFVIDTDAPPAIPEMLLQEALDNFAQTLLQSENPDVAYNICLVGGGQVLAPIQSIATYWTPPIPNGENVPFAESMALARQLWEEFYNAPISENIRHLPPWVVAINHSGNPDPDCVEFDALRLVFGRDLAQMRLTFLPLAFSSAASEYLAGWNNGFSVATLTADDLPNAFAELAQGVQEIAAVHHRDLSQDEEESIPEPTEESEVPEESEEEDDSEEEPSLPDWLFSPFDGEGHPLPDPEAVESDFENALKTLTSMFAEYADDEEPELPVVEGEEYLPEPTDEPTPLPNPDAFTGWDELPDSSEEMPEVIPEEVPAEVSEEIPGELPEEDSTASELGAIKAALNYVPESRRFPRPRRKGSVRRRAKLIRKLEDSNTQF